MKIDIKDWDTDEQQLRKCLQCEEWFNGDGFIYFDHEPTILVCSYTCAELFTADHNADEAEHINDQMKERRADK